MPNDLNIAQYSMEQFELGLHSVGGFVWWYLDLTDEQGSGLVLVWALGLPFLPGSRQGQRATRRPALHIAYYERGRQELYLLQQFPPDSASFTHGGEGELGRSKFSVRVTDEQLTVVARLDLEVPRSHERLVGEVMAHGPSVLLGDADTTANHVWTPRSITARGEASLRYGRESITMQGAAYFDSNLSRLPLQNQGIESWRWGRVSFPDVTLVYYDLMGEGETHTSTVFSQQTSSQPRPIADTPKFSRFRRGNFGLMGPRRVELVVDGDRFELELDLVEDGPFYHRYLVHGVRIGEPGSGHAGRCTGHGIAELVRPPLIDTPWQRPFVAMRTHYIMGHNSPLMPYFCGFKRDREERLARALLGRGAS